MKRFLLFHAISRGRKGSARRGILTFEWILIFALLIIGIVGGLAAVRDATIISFSGVAGAFGALDMGYTVDEVKLPNPAGGPDKVFAPGMKYEAPVFTVTADQPDTPPAPVTYP